MENLTRNLKERIGYYIGQAALLLEGATEQTGPTWLLEKDASDV